MYKLQIDLNHNQVDETAGNSDSDSSYRFIFEITS